MSLLGKRFWTKVLGLISQKFESFLCVVVMMGYCRWYLVDYGCRGKKPNNCIKGPLNGVTRYIMYSKYVVFKLAGIQNI